MIHDLKRQGLTVSAIARRVGLDRKTVRRHLERGMEPPAYGPRPPHPRQLAPFEAHLRERIAAWPELTGKRLLREVRELGYAGCYSGACSAALRVTARLWLRLRRQEREQTEAPPGE